MVNWYLRRFGALLLGGGIFLAGHRTVAMLTSHRHVELMTDLDRAIPLLPWTAWFYVPLYALGIILAGFLGRERSEFDRGALAAGIGLAMCSVGYFAVPSTYPRAAAFLGAPTAGIGTDILRFVHAIDPPNNTFPSAHVMVAVICADIGLRSSSRWRWLPVFTAVGVALSVLTTKQHYVVDSLAGAVVGAIALWLASRGMERWRPASPEPPRG